MTEIARSHLRDFNATKAGFVLSRSRYGRRAGVSALVLIAALLGPRPANAAGDTRTISLHHVHTRENLTITYKKNGQYDKNGDFVPVSWDEAFDIMADKWKTALKADGPGAVGMFGSGQWTIWEGYAASKLFKAGFRSNNLDPNARHCMAPAVAGFMRTFGIDEPMGCYDDIESADAFVLWGSNMAEMHPILWSRITDRKLPKPETKVVVMSTFEHRSFDLADIPIVFTPQTDLAIMNYICHHLISSGKVNKEFVKQHVNFAKGVDDIGYGLRPVHALEKDATSNGYPGADGQPKGFADAIEITNWLEAGAAGPLGGIVSFGEGAGGDGIDVDVMAAELLGEGLHQAHDGGLAGGVGRHRSGGELFVLWQDRVAAVHAATAGDDGVQIAVAACGLEHHHGAGAIGVVRGQHL